MGYLFENLWPAILLSALLGLFVGWWIWKAGRADGSSDMAGEAEDAKETEAKAEASEPVTEQPEEPAPPKSPPSAVEPAAETAKEPPDDPATPAEAVTAAAASPFLAAPDGEPDNLRQIKGVGPKLSDLLHELGIFHFSQIAAWTPEQVAEVDSQLGNFKGRIERDRWIDQARYLAEGDVAGFEHEFGSISG